MSFEFSGKKRVINVSSTICMERKISIIVILLLSELLSRCGNPINTVEIDNSNVMAVSISESKLDRNHLSDVFTIDKLIQLDISDNSIIGNINGLIVTETRIYILDKDQMKILAFDSSGKFIGEINRSGKGPFEYIYIGDFDYHNGNLYISDPTVDKMIVFDEDLKPVEEFRTQGNFHSFNVLDSNRFIYYSGNRGVPETRVDENLYNNVVFATKDKIQASFIPFHQSHDGKIIKAGRSDFSFVRYGTEEYFFSCLGMTVYRINENSTLSEFFKIAGQPPEFNEAKLTYDEYGGFLNEANFPNRMFSPYLCDKYIYYRFFDGSSTFSSYGVYSLDTKSNYVFDWERIDPNWNISINSIPYKGKDIGLLTSIDLSYIENKSILPDRVKNMLPKGDLINKNPILMTLKLKEGL